MKWFSHFFFKQPNLLKRSFTPLSGFCLALCWCWRTGMSQKHLETLIKLVGSWQSCLFGYNPVKLKGSFNSYIREWTSQVVVADQNSHLNLPSISWCYFKIKCYNIFADLSRPIIVKIPFSNLSSKMPKWRPKWNYLAIQFHKWPFAYFKMNTNWAVKPVATNEPFEASISFTCMRSMLYFFEGNIDFPKY